MCLFTASLCIFQRMYASIYDSGALRIFHSKGAFLFILIQSDLQMLQISLHQLHISDAPLKISLAHVVDGVKL